MRSTRVNLRCILLGMAMIVSWGCGESQEESRLPTKVNLTLGGENCEFYLGAVEEALKKVQGVQIVDLKSQKGQALMITDGTVKPKQLAQTVEVLSGEGWNCEADLVDS